MMKLAAVLLLAAGASARERPVVSMTIGAVRGNALGDVADEFLGIPYGDAPRFEPAVVRTAPLEGTLDGSYFGPACLQVLTNVTTYGVEHGCHVLNVWRPAGAAADAALPVIMFVPGGSNDFGEAEPYNASMLASAQHAVVASINYRVGPFGFLAFEEDVGERATGNWALTDIQAALVFLRREVGAFGGDPRRLTIFGQSSGASLCNLHAVLPSSRGLLEGIVSESGGLDAGDARSALKNERVVADYLGCGNATRKACVANAAGDDLVYSQDVRCVTPNDCSAATSWGPVVDGFLLPDAPARLLARSEVNDVALVLGANTNDSYLFIMNEGPVKKRDYVASLREDARGDAKAFRELERLYPATADPRENSRRMGWKASDSMLCGLRRTAAGFEEAGAKAYLYRFDYWFQSDETCTAVANWHPPEFGSMHQDEISFVFGQPIKMNLGYTNCSEPGPTYDKSCLGCAFDATEAAFAKKVGQFWTNFAASGDPNKRGGSDALGEWPRAAEDRNIVLEPTADMKMRDEPKVGAANCDVWDAIAAGGGGL